MGVTVFSKKRCPHCKKVKRRLKMESIEFDEIDISAKENESLLKEFKNAKFSNLPFISYNGYEIEYSEQEFEDLLIKIKGE